MVWHDCKTDPPKKSGLYILCFLTPRGKSWDRAYYDCNDMTWEDIGCLALYGVKDDAYELYIPYKWAEVDLSEVE